MNDTFVIMYDSIESTQGGPAVGRWLLFIHQIPPKPDYLRVKVRRRLTRIGAVALKNSVYVLPHTDDAVEDLQWLRRVVVDDGGEATVCSTVFLEGVSDQEVESMFRTQSDGEYDEIIGAARAAAAEPSHAGVRRLKRQLAGASARDHFDAPRAVEAAGTVRALESALAGDRRTVSPAARGADVVTPTGATWVTRKGVYVDRIASAWLIRRFIDEQARFKFVSGKGYRPTSTELRFDMFEGEFTHEGDRCTFEVLVARFALHDAALGAIAEIVHDIDCKDEKFGRDEAAGVASLLRGLALAHADDAGRIEAGATLFDGLYAAFERPGA